MYKITISAYKKCLSLFSNRNMAKACFKFSDYDCVGFDLDNTISEYSVYKLASLEYDLLAKYLLNTGRYKSEYILQPFNDGLDFIRRGLILDINKGNILDISYEGTILRANHGTRILDVEDIVKVYGKTRTWDVTDKFCNDFLETWNGPLSEEMRSLLDYFDISVSLLFARGVDNIDAENGAPVQKYHVWEDILAGLWDMFAKENFQLDVGGYFPALKKDPSAYIKMCSPEFLCWLEELKQSGKITCMITGSFIDYADFIAENSMGADWKKYFDVIIYYARKPGFFVSNRPFKKVVDESEADIITVADIKLPDRYTQGNWNDLYEVFKKRLNKDSVKCVYVGDNLIQDIFAPAKLNIDTVAVINELKAENAVACGDTTNLDVMTAASSTWGSYFKDPLSGKLTIWGKIVHKHSKICVPDVDTLATKELTYAYETFADDDNDEDIVGYYPAPPASIRGVNLSLGNNSS